ncbi:MAG: CHRD domain-containing protein [Gemmatimonadota bacterium]
MSPKAILLAITAVVGTAWTGTASRTAASPEFVANMTSSQETPANSSGATGTATFHVADNKLHYVVRVNGLSGSATAAHIHVGAAGVAGPPVFTFDIKSGVGKNGAIAEGTFDLKMSATASVTGDSLMTLLGNGNAYVNVHTAKYPNGETRGQVMVKK